MDESLNIVCWHCDTTNRVPEERLREQPHCGKCNELLFAGKPIDLHGGNFMKHITRNDIPVLVDFWAPWCGPCRTMAPAYEQAAKQLEPEFRVAKLNTEEAQQLASQYAIRSIPTLALFKHGVELGRQPGAMDATRIVAWAQAKAHEVIKQKV
jgi:thioredoxin 2